MESLYKRMYVEVGREFVIQIGVRKAQSENSERAAQRRWQARVGQ
jgi:hypothetical protein